MIRRIWCGWTHPEQARAYEALLRDVVFPGIAAKQIPGYRGIELLRRDLDDEVEFMTIMQFDSLDSVIAFQGADYARCYVPPEARRLLSRWEERSRHFESIATRREGAG